MPLHACMAGVQHIYIQETPGTRREPRDRRDRATARRGGGGGSTARMKKMPKKRANEVARRGNRGKIRTDHEEATYDDGRCSKDGKVEESILWNRSVLSLQSLLRAAAR